ncbi:hypothetical protein PSTT_11399 [Puccinia striiformis]|uniref:Reverse transcriptase domain-containing protein n=1 Tax=Puccinia striiformis TaxID=27350 RepID=A0A2S4V0M5_9BASI|nr:hypothetical protein PSTT_11399 [Puccinia striiformis]
MTHTSFSGNPKELNKFIYFIKDRLVEVESRFQSEKSKINWIVRHFRHPNGNISDATPSYNWWISLLKENARAQDLNPLHASAEDPYFLPCLKSLRNFLTKIEEVFADRNSIEDAKRALYSCKQGNLSLDVFNSLFSSLVYAVDLTEPSRIDIYKRAINPKILELAIMRDTWNVANTLREKQDLAIMASNVLDELAQLRNAASVRTPNYQPQLPPPPPAATPMDIDSITASSGFTFPLYRSICIKNKLCQRCHKAYDKAHITNRSCPNVEVSIKEKIDLYTRLSRGHPPVALAEVNLSSINPDAPVQSWDSVGVNSFADMLMYGSDEDGNIIDQGELFFSIASLSTSLPLPPKPSFLPPPNTDPSRLVIPIKLLLPGLPPVTAMALIDSGAGGLFINKTSSFDGSPATSGDVTHYWSGQITGLPWLKDNLAWVGGPYGQLFFSSHSNTSNRTLPISTQSLAIASITNNVLLNQEEILSLPLVLRSFSDVFTIASLQTLPPVRPQFDLKIQLKPDCTPPFGGLYNLSESERRQLREYIDENLSKGFIRLSSSPAAAPIFFVKTEGKDDRPCVDYRGLNAITVRDSYPIPVLSLLLNNLAGCKYLSKVDLKSAFNLLRVTPGQEYLTAFRTPWGLFEYMVMPFGLANAPATFQRFIQYVLREYIDVCCFVYIDDILIFSKTEEDHVKHLKAILTKLREYSLKALLKKCPFFQTQVQFLGFIISSQGLRMDPMKLDTILNGRSQKH